MEYIIDYALIDPCTLASAINNGTCGYADVVLFEDIDEDKFLVLVDSFEDDCPDNIFDLVAKVVNPFLFLG